MNNNMKEENTRIKVIGAGLPRTGTLTMKTALEMLYGSKCYHMIDFIIKGDCY